MKRKTTSNNAAAAQCAGRNHCTINKLNVQVYEVSIHFHLIIFKRTKFKLILSDKLRINCFALLDIKQNKNNVIEIMFYDVSSTFHCYLYTYLHE